jgi:hypothetical protein
MANVQCDGLRGKNCATRRGVSAECVQRLEAEDTDAVTGASARDAERMGLGLDAEGCRRRTARGGPDPQRRCRREDRRVRRGHTGRGRNHENPGCARGAHGRLAVAGPDAAIGRQGADSCRAAAVVQRSARCALSLASVFAHAADAYGRERKDEQHLQDGGTTKEDRAASHCRRPVLIEPRVDAAGQLPSRNFASATFDAQSLNGWPLRPLATLEFGDQHGN